MIRLETLDQSGKPVDIGSKLTLHICVPDIVPPLSVTPPVPDQAEQVREELLQRRRVADGMIQHMQDILDIGEGTNEIESSILKWKRFRVALNRVADQIGYPDYVEWPDLPE